MACGLEPEVDITDDALGLLVEVAPPPLPRPAARDAVPDTRWPRITGTLVAVIGACGLAGWIFDIRFLRSITSGLASMKFNTACCLVLLGVAVVRGARDHWASIAAAVVAGITGFTLLEYLAGSSFAIDNLVIQDADSPAHPGRMSISAAVCLLCGAGTIFAIRHSRPRIAQTLASVIMVAGWLAVLGYAFDVQELYRVGPFSRMAIHSAVALLFLAIGLLASIPGGMVPWILTGNDPGATLLRRMLPIGVVGLPIIGGLVALGLHADVYGAGFATAIMVVVAASVATLVALVSARVIRREDARRRAAVDRLAIAEDEERERIAVEIHDETIQHLIGARLYVEAMHRRLIGGRLTDADASERLESIQQGMTAAITSVRDVIFDLAPPHLDGGLIEATTLLAKRLFGDTDTAATVSGSEPDLVPRDAQLVYRIIAEALRNVRRHAHASSVEVDFDCRSTEIVVSVRDDGMGFPEEGPEQRPGHLGLRTMSERAQALGGTYSITRRPGGGTVVAVRIDAIAAARG